MTLWAVLVAVAVSGIWVAALPVSAVSVGRWYGREMDAERQQWAIRHAIREHRDVTAPVTLDSVRDSIRSGLPLKLREMNRRPLQYLIREEDSPFNYSLRGRSNGVELLLYDFLGQAEVIPLPE